MMRNGENAAAAQHASQSDASPSDTRQSGSQEDAPPILMYTTAWCVACWRAKEVMDAMQVAYTEIDINADEEAAEEVERLNRGYRSVPTLIFPDGSVMTEPRTNALVEKLQTLM